MSIAQIDPEFKPRPIMVGWKVVKKSMIKDNIYYPMYIQLEFRARRKYVARTIKEIRKICGNQSKYTIGFMESPYYKKGFHFFGRRKDAIAHNRTQAFGSVVKVLAFDIVYSGWPYYEWESNPNGRVYVANAIIIDPTKEQIERYTKK